MFILKRSMLVAVLPLFLGLPLQAQPSISTGGTVNAADYSRDFAPGAIISIFGNNLAAASGGATSVPLPSSLGGASVELVTATNTQSLPLFYVSPSQINAELPYGLAPGTFQIRVRTGIGVSATDTITVVARAPKIFTVDFTGKGSAVVTNAGFAIVTQGANPVKPADNIIIWMNSLGEANPPLIAGSAAPGGPGIPPATIGDPVTVTIGGKPAKVTFAGAAPAYSGLYQVNVQAPFLVLTGPLDVQVSVGNGLSQSGVNAAYRQLGFYNAVLGGKPGSQAVTGSDSLAYRQTDALVYGQAGLGQWTKPASAIFDATVMGEAVTWKNGASVVFDNNGVEDKSGAGFYSNAGGGPDNQKPGLVNLYAMSNYFPLIFSTYMKFSQPVSVTEMIGYFDATGTRDVPFDPNNAFIRYRMNIWSSAAALPKENGGYVGDIFSSDSTAGTFSISATGLNRVSSNANAVPDPIWRLDYKLNSPITLPAGEYWFAHDASIRDNPTSSTSTAAALTPTELAGIIRMQPQSANAVRFSFFGREMVYQESWMLPFAVEIRPVSPISTKEF